MADIALLDLFGTARQFFGHFMDDGESRRTLDLSYLEPLVFGSPFDMRVALGQRHDEGSYDTILGELSWRLPWRAATELELGGGVDRTSFVGEEGRLRTRRRADFRFRAGALRPISGAGLYGRLDSRVSYARVSQTYADAQAGQETASTSDQTIVDGDLRLGLAVGRSMAFAARGRFASVITQDLPIPESEQFFIGGATTVRGHRQDEHHGETISHGSLEFVLGPARGGQAYVFYDLGWWRDTQEQSGRIVREQGWMRGFGLGLRTPAPFGRLDLSLGFAGRLSFDDGLIHLALISVF
jgi:hemolysin activation/secretion protein